MNPPPSGHHWPTARQRVALGGVIASTGLVITVLVGFCAATFAVTFAALLFAVAALLYRPGRRVPIAAVTAAGTCALATLAVVGAPLTALLGAFTFTAAGLLDTHRHAPSGAVPGR